MERARAMSVVVGVDVGGTFTDLVVYDEEKGVLTVVKTLTNPRNPVESIREALEEAGVDPTRVGVIVHASTLGTNIFFGQEGLKLPKTALITTRGFRDVLEIGRQCRPRLYSLHIEKPRPLVPRRSRFEVTERLDAQGRVLVPLDEEEAWRLGEKLCREGYQVAAIVLLHSYANPVHEEKLKTILEKACPGLVVVASHEVDPQPGEYERTSTTVLNAMLKPLMRTYLSKLLRELRERGFQGQLLVMHSSGGVVPVWEAVERPAAFIESGPAAGVVAAAHLSKLLGHSMVLSFDMGGTTAKASAVVNGEPLVAYEYEVGGLTHMGRRVRGTGYPVRYQFIDIVEVGAGGGTIAWVDEGGALRVGPMSAGADPGPACYGRGGTRPTVTDANLVLGRLGEKLAGGKLKLDRGLAVKALSQLADQLGMDVVEAAYAVVTLANSVMARALRMVTVERGLDPQDFTLYAFGGCGPLHAAELAAEIGIKRILVPREPGVFSALGLLVADCKTVAYKAVGKLVDELDEAELEQLYTKLVGEATPRLRACNPVEVKVARLLGLRLQGQASDLVVAWRGSIEETLKTFREKYASLYGVEPEDPVEATTAYVVAVGVRSKPRQHCTKTRSYKPEPTGRRDVFIGGDWVEASTYDRRLLRPGALVEGPAVVEEYGSTTLVPPGAMCTVDCYGNLAIELEG